MSMCITCVAAGTTYAVPAIVGLKVYAARARRRRSTEPAVAPGEAGTAPRGSSVPRRSPTSSQADHHGTCASASSR